MTRISRHSSYIYLDDILIFGRTFEETVKSLDMVLFRLKHYHLKVKPEKCQLFYQCLRYLGHMVAEGGISLVCAIWSSGAIAGTLKVQLSVNSAKCMGNEITNYSLPPRRKTDNVSGSTEPCMICCRHCHETRRGGGQNTCLNWSMHTTARHINLLDISLHTASLVVRHDCLVTIHWMSEKTSQTSVLMTGSLLQTRAFRLGGSRMEKEALRRARTHISKARPSDIPIGAHVFLRKRGIKGRYKIQDAYDDKLYKVINRLQDHVYVLFTEINCYL